ncbi:hypothetical protein N7486_004741 [Penicillium sp. IBT 16267x]|nr:hypothetical protein N7486_004741 [Penicillium sp. IBT 16267x]
MIDKLRKELDPHSSGQAREGDYKQAGPVRGDEKPGIEPTKRKRTADTADITPKHTEPARDVEMSGTGLTARDMNSTSKTIYPEYGTDENKREPNIPVQPQESQANPPPGKSGNRRR